jgi:hypothetical protein
MLARVHIETNALKRVWSVGAAARVAASASRSDLAEYGEHLEAGRSLRIGVSPLYYAIAKFEDES